MKVQGTFLLALSILIVLLATPTAILAPSIRGDEILGWAMILSALASLSSIPVRWRWRRSDLPFLLVGAALVGDALLGAYVHVSAWSNWTMGMLYLAGMFLLQRIDMAGGRKDGPGFSAEEERTLFWSALRAGASGGAWLAMPLIASLALLAMLPWLTVPSIAIWTVAVLALIALFSMTWLTRAKT